MANPDYQILETELGPMISRSRTSVYDVMEMQNKGYDLLSLCTIHNLNPVQVMVALEYIEQHRKRLEPELKELLEKRAEREQYYRLLAAERQKMIAQKPMTPKRAAFYVQRERNRRLREERKSNGTNHS